MGLEEKIRDRRARVGVVGLGYVGLPLAVEFAKAGFDTTGIETERARADGVNRGSSYVEDISDEDLAAAVSAGKLRAKVSRFSKG